MKKLTKKIKSAAKDGGVWLFIILIAILLAAIIKLGLLYKENHKDISPDEYLQEFESESTYY